MKLFFVIALLAPAALAVPGGGGHGPSGASPGVKVESGIGIDIDIDAIKVGVPDSVLEAMQYYPVEVPFKFNLTNITTECSVPNPGIDQMLHVTLAFSDCEDLNQMGEVLAGRFWNVPIPVLALKFFKWITMDIPHDYRNAGGMCFFNILINQKIPNQYLARLSYDWINLYKMQTQIPPQDLIAPDFFDNPIPNAVRLGVALTYLTAVVADVFGPLIVGMIFEQDVLPKFFQAIFYIVQNLVAALTEGNLYLGKDVKASDWLKAIPNAANVPLKFLKQKPISAEKLALMKAQWAEHEGKNQASTSKPKDGEKGEGGKKGGAHHS